MTIAYTIVLLCPAKLLSRLQKNTLLPLTSTEWFLIFHCPTSLVCKWTLPSIFCLEVRFILLREMLSRAHSLIPCYGADQPGSWLSLVFGKSLKINLKALLRLNQRFFRTFQDGQKDMDLKKLETNRLVKMHQ